MADRLRGVMVRVLDGDTFVFTRNWAASSNEHSNYPLRMVIRLRRGDAPEEGEPGYDLATRYLRRQLQDERIEVQVHHYDRARNRSYATVSIVVNGHAKHAVVVLDGADLEAAIWWRRLRRLGVLGLLLGGAWWALDGVRGPSPRSDPPGA